MVLVKRKLEYGVNNGYRSTVIPRAPRSIRKRGFRQKSIEGGQVCAFDLLATVAGKLLEESECSSASSSAVVRFDQCGIDKDAVKNEPQDVDKPLGGDHDDQGSSESSVFFSGLQKDTCKGKLETVNEMTGEHASPFVSSTISEKVDSDSKLVTQKYDETYVKDSCKIDGGSPKCGEFDDTNDIDNRFIRHLDTNGVNFGDITTTNKSPAPTISEENVELIPCRGSTPNPNASLNHGNNVKRNCKDDDEILSQYSLPNNTTKVYRSPSAADCKLLTSKYWEIAPKLKDYELSDTDDGAKYIDSAKRSCYDVDRSQRNTPFKKRRLIDRSSVVTYDGGISCESVSNSPEKGIGDEKNGSARKLHEGKGTPSSGLCRQKSFKSRNSQVRLSIKSFKVPELFIDVPESTTVDSLKRTVLETVTTILGGGLRVGVLLHGKKIRDDNRTLLQSGIAQSDDMGTVEFMLEPNSPTQPSPPKGREEPPAPPSCDSPKFVNRSRVNTNDDTFVINTPEKPSITDANRSSGTGIKNFVPSLTAELTDKNVSDSKALVPVPEASGRALAVVPVNHRSKCADIGQRRTRRPFSVSEVEALVRAVENLGTGRWRDVKLCAFENAKHRTYVDLKDKWKTLVHTARISPQQRRGEPVPQELLDRVLAAQSYWSEHQAKQHGKHHQQQGIIPQLTDAIVGEA